MSTNQPIVVQNHVHGDSSSAREVINFVATIIIFGGVGGVIWTVAQQGYAEIGASGAAIMIVQMVKMMLDARVLAKPKKEGKQHFTGLSADLRRYADEFTAWRADRTLAQMAGLALGYAIGFLLLRAGLLAALGIFHNVVFAISFFAVVGGCLAAPTWFHRYRDPARSAGIYNPDALRTPAPAPVPQPAPTPTPAPAKRVVVRKTIKKENDNV